jgi:hypothetical protein
MDGELAARDVEIDELRMANSKLMLKVKTLEKRIGVPIEYEEQTVAEEVIDELFG